MNHFVIDAKLTEDQKETLGHLAKKHEQEFHLHKDKTGIDYTHLDIMILNDNPVADKVAEQFSVKPNRVSLMRVAPNATIVPHVDGKDYQRLSAIVFPILPVMEDFTPTSFYHAGNGNKKYSHSSECYAFDTQQMHGVENNDNYRLSLQLWYDMSLTELKKMII